MRYLLVFLIAVFAVTAVSSAEDGIDFPVEKTQELGSLLRGVIQKIAQIIIQYEVRLIRKLATPYATVPIDSLSEDLDNLRNPTVESVLNKVLSYVDLPSAAVFRALPDVISDVPVDVRQLKSALRKNVSGDNVQFSILIKNLGDFLVPLFTDTFVSILNSLKWQRN